MSLTKLFIADSNVGRFWDDAIADRAAVRNNCFLYPCDDLITLEQAGALISPRLDAVVISMMTNPIREAVANSGFSGTGSSSIAREAVIAALRNILVLQIFPICSTNMDVKFYLDPPRACQTPEWYHNNFWIICDEFSRFVPRFPANLILLQPFVHNVFVDDGVHFQKFVGQAFVKHLIDSSEEQGIRLAATIEPMMSHVFNLNHVADLRMEAFRSRLDRLEARTNNFSVQRLDSNQNEMSRFNAISQAQPASDLAHEVAVDPFRNDPVGSKDFDVGVHDVRVSDDEGPSRRYDYHLPKPFNPNYTMPWANDRVEPPMSDVNGRFSSPSSGSRSTSGSEDLNQRRHSMILLAKQAFRHDIEEFIKSCIDSVFRAKAWGFSDQLKTRKLLVDRASEKIYLAEVYQWEGQSRNNPDDLKLTAAMKAKIHGHVRKEVEHEATKIKNG